MRKRLPLITHHLSLITALLLVLVVVGVLAEVNVGAAAAGDGVALLVEGHAEVEPHAVQDFLNLVERLLAEVLRREHLALAALNEVAYRTNVRVLQAVVRAHRQLKLVNRAVEHVVARQGRALDVLVGELVRVLLEVDEDLHVILYQLRGEPDGVVRLHGAVRPDLNRQLVELGVLAQTSGLDRVFHLLDRRVNRFHRDVAERQVLVEVALGGDVAAPALEAHLDGQRAALADGRDVDVRVEDFHVGVGLYVGRRDLARAVAVNRQGLGLGAVELEGHLLEVEYNVGRVLDDAAYGRELVLDALDLDGGDGRALNRREQRAAQGVADGRAEAALERLRGEAPVSLRERVALDGEAARHLKTRPEVVLIHCHSRNTFV